MDFLRLAGVAAIAYWLLSKAGTYLYERIDVERIRVKVLNIDWPSLSLNLRLFIDLKNNSKVSVPVEGFTGALLYGDYQVAVLNINQPVLIEANGQATLVINSLVSLADLGINISDMIANGTWYQYFRVKGLLRLRGGVNVPVDSVIQIL